VSFYFDWGYHSPKPGGYDMNRLLTTADEVGRYVVARPGPYINAEVDGGGFPGWLTTQAGRALAVTSDGGPGDTLEDVRLTSLATVRGGVPVALVRSPGWRH